MKKRVFLISVAALFSATLLSGGAADAITCPTGYSLVGDICIPGGTGLSTSSVASIIATALNWLLYIMTAVAVLAFVISGLQYLTSAGDESQAETAKKTMKFAIIGIAVALSGLIIVSTVNSLLRGSVPTGTGGSASTGVGTGTGTGTGTGAGSSTSIPQCTMYVSGNGTYSIGEVVSIDMVDCTPEPDSYIWSYPSDAPPVSGIGGTIRFLRAGTYTYTARGANGAGVSSPSSATLTVTAAGGGGCVTGVAGVTGTCGSNSCLPGEDNNGHGGCPGFLDLCCYTP